MKEVVDVGLPQSGQPFSWAVKSGGVLYTTHGPVLPDGSIDVGSIETQTRLTFDNLKRAVIAAGATMSDVAQVLIYLVDAADMPPVDRIYREYFDAPFPNRSSLVVKALVVPSMKIEVVAYAAVN